ncbi:MAG: hypothetical protein EXX96DRAFT_582728 [Benjaminiella poitrasii]|nr:MAG: hypothetical protein EXX96DRAFT_582728 [Benjaminiella poitrasii]
MAKATKRQKDQKRTDEGTTIKKFKSSESLHISSDEADSNEISDMSIDIAMNEKIELVLNKLNFMAQTIQHLMNDIGDLKTDVQDIKQSLSQPSNNNETAVDPILIDRKNPTPSNNIVLLETVSPSSLPPTTRGPFPEYSSTDRTVSRPSTRDLAETTGGKAHSLQFTSHLYINLIESVLGPAQDSGLDYRAMVKEAVLVTKSVISQVKEYYHLDQDLRWSQVDPTVRLDAYRRLELATQHLLPLKVCSEFWGAHVLLSNFWLKRKKSRASITNNSNRGSPTSSHSSQCSITPALKSQNRKRSSALKNTSNQNTPQDDEKKPPAFSISFLTH